MASINDTIHSTMIPFHRQTCIRHEVVAVAGFCDGPKDNYKGSLHSTDPTTVFEDMRMAWYKKGGTYSSVKRDLLYLFVGKWTKKYAEQSYICSLCNYEKRYACVVYGCVTWLITHEVGHAFGGKHVHGGLLGTDHIQKWLTQLNLRNIRHCPRKRIECRSDGNMQPRFMVFEERRYTCQTGFK